MSVRNSANTRGDHPSRSEAQLARADHVSQVRIALITSSIAILGFWLWPLVTTRVPGKLLGAYGERTFLILVGATYAVAWGLYLAFSRAPIAQRAGHCALATFTLLVLVALFELPAALGSIDYRYVLLPEARMQNPPWSGLMAQLRFRHGAQLDKELFVIHPPNGHYTGELMGDIAARFRIQNPRLYPCDVRYDSRGFRNIHQIERADLVLLGDSMLEWPLVPQEALLSSRLRTLLGTEVANLAHSGYGPQQELIVLRRFGLPLRPKTVLWFFFEGNDLSDVSEYEERKAGWDEEVRKFTSFRRRSFVRNTLLALTVWTSPIDHSPNRLNESCFFSKAQSESDRTLYFGYQARPLTAEDHRNLAVAQRLFLEAQRLASEEGARFLLIYIPTKFRVYQDYCLYPADSPVKGWQPNELPALMEEWAHKHGVPFLDLTPSLRKATSAGPLVYFSDDTHLNDRGHGVAAEAIQEWMRVHGWLN